MKLIYWHTCGLTEIYYPEKTEKKTGDMLSCPELGVSSEGTSCIVFVEVIA